MREFVLLLFRRVRLRPFPWRNAGFLTGRVSRGRRTGVMFALALPLLFSGVGPGLKAQFPVPSAAGIRAMLHAATGQHAAAPGVPKQESAGAASAHPGQVPTAVTRAVSRAEGSKPVTVPGVVPPYQVHGPSAKKVTTGPEAGGAGSAYNPATSVLVQAGTNATTSLYRNADGTYTERVYAAPVNRKTSGGAWVGVVAGAGKAARGAPGTAAGALPVGFNGSGRSVAVLGVPTAGFAGVPKGFHATAASLNLFDVAASQCSSQSTVSVYAVRGTAPAGSAASYTGQAAPATGRKLGSWAGVAPAGACAVSGTGQGGWISVPFNHAGLAAIGSAAAKGIGVAVEGPASDRRGWKEFAGTRGTGAASLASSSLASSSLAPTAGGGTPYLDVTLAAAAAPEISSQFPPDNYSEPTLTPELIAEGSGGSGTLTYGFAVYTASGQEIDSATALSTGDWTVPAGDLSWDTTYYWTAVVSDGSSSSTPVISWFATPVPQPLLTSSLSQNKTGPGFDAATGDWTMSATDAHVATVGPALEITRDYNSQDPRSSGAFGAGWSSVLDMRVRPGQQNAQGTTQTEVVTYPNGQDVAFGLDPGGKTYSPPQGRYAELRAQSSGGFTLTDKNDTVYTFAQSLGSGTYGITSIADADNRTETFTWNATAQITQVTSASGRSLYLAWGWPSGANYSHVGSVTTDPVTSGNSSSALTWTYSYSGDDLTGVCAPGSSGKCTAYTYQQGSDYRDAVLDSGPYAYWRLDETSGSTAADSVLANEGTDNASYSGVTLGQDSGPLAGSSATSASFNGSSSYVTLKQGLVSGATYQSISLWFRTTGTDEVLFSYQAAPITAGSTTARWVPAIYVGSDGLLNAQYWNGTAAPLQSKSPVNDGQWHQVTLTAAGNTQSLYVDGTDIGSLSGAVDVAGMTNNYIGTGYIGGGWPDEQYNGSSTAYPEYFSGDISDVAFWNRALTTDEAQTLYADGTYPSALLTEVTRPTGSVYAQVGYDALTGRAVTVTDPNGGTWNIPVPTQDTGSSKVYVASVLGDIPGDYYRLDDTNSVNPTNEVNGGAATYNDVTEGVTPGLFSDRTVDSFNGSSSYIALPQGLTSQDGVESVGLWFKTTTAGGTLFSTSANPLAATTSGDYSGGLYIGSDGKLVGAFFDGNAADVVSSPAAVDDGKWHFAVLAADSTGQAVYLDGTRLGTLSAGLDSPDQSYEYVGAGFLGGGWPDEPHNDPANDTGYASYFTGDIAEVAWYHASLTVSQVADQWKASKYSSGLTPVQTEQVTDPGGKTLTYVYDPLHGYRIVRETNGDGDTTKYGYDVRGFRDRVVDPNGNVTDSGYDSRGNMISEQTCQNQAAGVCATARWSYYPSGNSGENLTPDPRNDEVLTYKDPRTGDNAASTAYQTNYSYDAQGNLTSVTTPPTARFPSGKTTSYAYTDGSTSTGGYQGAVPPAGLPYKKISPGGAVTTTLYDAAGDVMQITNPDGQVTDYAYDGLGRMTSKTVISASYPSGLTTSYSYNGIGQVTQQTDPPVTDRVTGAQHTAVTTTSYDADGDMLSQTTSDATGGDASRTVSYAYNGYDQLTSQTDPAGGVTRYTWDAYGNKASQTDADGNVTDYTYDAEGHLLTTTLENYTGSPPGSQSAGPLVEESRSYDPAGRLASVTDAMGFVTSYGYTDNNLVSSVTRSDPASGDSYTVQQNTYDAAGNLTKRVTNNGGTETDYTVNADNQVTSQVLDPANLDRVTSYAYTPDDQVLTTTVSNGATAVANGQPSGPVKVTGYAYDGTGATAATLVYGDSTPSLAPSGWWPLNDGAAASKGYTPATAADESGNGNTATVQQGASWSGDAASFSGGSSAPAIAATGPVVDTSASFTVSAWVNVAADTGSVEGIVADHSAQEDGFRLDYNGGTWEFSRAAADTSAAPSYDVAGSSASLGTWTHLVGTFDSSTGAMTLYVNGQAASTATDSTAFKASGPLAIGNLEYEGGDGNPLDGLVANVQVYPYALSGSQVSSLYSEGRSGTPLGMQGTTTTWTLGERGLPTSMTDPDGNTTTYSYDAAGQLAVSTGPQVTSETYSVSSGSDTAVATRPVTTIGYDTFGDKAETQDADGNVTVYSYDGDGRLVSKTLPDYTPPDGSGPYTQAAGTSAVATMTYDGDGLLTSSTDPMGNVTKYAYDQQGNRVSVTAPDGSVTATAYDADGQPLSVTGPTGAVTESTWDFLGRKLTSTQVERYPSSASYTTAYAYSASSNDPGGTWPSTVTSPDGVSTEYGYDAAGEKTWSADGAGDVTNYWYDALGRRNAVINPDGTVTGTDYNLQGQPVDQEKLDANFNQLSVKSWTYNGDGNMTSATDAAGNTTTFSYNAAGMLTGEIQPVSATSSITTSFGYDAAGNQTRYTDGNGNSWYQTYNSWGLRESRVEPATSQYTSAADSVFTTSYNADGNPVTAAEPGGVTITSSYNSVGELTGQAGTGAVAATPARSFGYDAAGNLTSASTSNTAASGSASNATSESFTYNDRGLVLSASGSAGSTSYTYNGDGQVASIADAAGTTSYTYDSAGRLATLADPLTGTTLSYSYTPDSQVSQISYGSGGDTRSFSYDSQHRLTSDTLATASGTTIASVSYTYNANSQVTSQDTSGSLAGPTASTYTYDQAGRLTSWNNGTTTTSYGYDANGNLTQNGSKTYTYNARDELTSDGTNSYSYTARGTPSSEVTPTGTVATAFDAYGRQATAGSNSYTYDALGRLTADTPTAGGSGSQFSYAGSTTTIASDGTTAYTWGPSGGTLIAAGAPGGGSGGSLALTNIHGDVIGQFTATATGLSGSQAYDPWGTVTATTGALTGQLGYQSGWTDAATGKVAMGARWYAPGTGSFTSADSVQVSPVPNPAAGNPFSYAAANPLSNIDPTGHALVPVAGGGTSSPPPAPEAINSPSCIANVAACLLAAGLITTGGQVAPPSASKALNNAEAVAEKKALSPSDTAPTDSACSGIITTQVNMCVLQYYRSHSGKLNGQGLPTGKGYVPPAPPLTIKVGPITLPASYPHAYQIQVGYETFLATYFQQKQWEVPVTIAYELDALTTFCLGVDTGGSRALCGATLSNMLLGDHMAMVARTDPGALVPGGALVGDMAGAAGGEADNGLPITARIAAADQQAADESLSIDQQLGTSCFIGIGGSSFTPATRVLLASGKAVPISTLKPGDKVLAADTRTGRNQPETVTAVLVHHDTNLYNLTIRTRGHTEIIHTTSNHLFWDPSLNKFLPASNLRPGTHLKTPDGQAAVVGGSVPADHGGWMWDLTVPGNNDHDFYVAAGSAAVLVHNDCGPVTVPKGTTVYRSDTRDPSVIFGEGFKPKGSNLNLEEHVAGVSGVYTPDSGYVSTTTSEAHALSRSGVTYTIELPTSGGVDVNATITDNPHANENEVAYPGTIPSEYIVGATLPDGTWVPNPNFAG